MKTSETLEPLAGVPVNMTGGGTSKATSTNDGGIARFHITDTVRERLAVTGNQPGYVVNAAAAMNPENSMLQGSFSGNDGLDAIMSALAERALEEKWTKSDLTHTYGIDAEVNQLSAPAALLVGEGALGRQDWDGALTAYRRAATDPVVAQSFAPRLYEGLLRAVSGKLEESTPQKVKHGKLQCRSIHSANSALEEINGLSSGAEPEQAIVDRSEQALAAYVTSKETMAEVESIAPVICAEQLVKFSHYLGIDAGRLIAMRDDVREAYLENLATEYRERRENAGPDQTLQWLREYLDDLGNVPVSGEILDEIRALEVEKVGGPDSDAMREAVMAYLQAVGELEPEGEPAGFEVRRIGCDNLRVEEEYLCRYRLFVDEPKARDELHRMLGGWPMGTGMEAELRSRFVLTAFGWRLLAE